MFNVFILVNAQVKESGKIIAASPATERMVAAVREAIATYSPKPINVKVVAASDLRSYSGFEIPKQQVIYCPLTIQIPDSFQFPHQGIFHACKDIKGTRRLVEEHLGYKISVNDSWLGDLWFPVVLTDRGPMYGEAIEEGEMPNSYHQPVKLSDRHRQPLYNLAASLLTSLQAPPAVYLLQFGLKDGNILFDRLWPFPAAPAIASLKLQQPNLFICHWCCLTGQPILDFINMENIE